MLKRICWRRSTSCFVYGFVFQVISEKHYIANILQGIWERFLYEMIMAMIPTNLAANSLLCLVWPFVEMKNKNQISASCQ